MVGWLNREWERVICLHTHITTPVSLFLSIKKFFSEKFSILIIEGSQFFNNLGILFSFSNTFSLFLVLVWKKVYFCAKEKHYGVVDRRVHTFRYIIYKNTLLCTTQSDIFSIFWSNLLIKIRTKTINNGNSIIRLLNSGNLEQGGWHFNMS